MPQQQPQTKNNTNTPKRLNMDKVQEQNKRDAETTKTKYQRWPQTRLSHAQASIGIILAMHIPLYRYCYAVKCRLFNTDIAIQIFLYSYCYTDIAMPHIWKDIAIRMSLYGYCYTDIAIRMLLYGWCYTDIAVRILLYGYCYTDTAIRRWLGAHCYTDIAIRILQNHGWGSTTEMRMCA